MQFRALVVATLLIVACGGEKTSGVDKSAAPEVTRHLKTDSRKATGLAASGGARPSLVIHGVPDALAAPMRDYLEKSKVAPKGHVAIKAVIDPADPKATGTLNVRLTIVASFQHAPNSTDINATIAGTIDHVNAPPERLGAELGNVVEDFLASQKLPANVGPGKAVAKAVAITAGDNNCTLHEDKTVRCWSLDVARPTEIPTIAGSTQVSSAGNYGTCGLRESGKAYCIDAWDNTIAFEARDVCGIESATAVDTGGHGACALLRDGTVRCWGRDKRFFAPCDKPTAREVKGVANAIDLRVGTFDACVRTADGGVQCWKMDKALAAAPVKALAKSTHLLPEFELCGARDATVTCVNPSTKEVHTTLVPEPVKKLVRGVNDVCALVTSGQLYCWNRYAEAGPAKKQPASLAAFRDVIDVAASLESLCAVDSKGAVQCVNAGVGGKLTDPPKTIAF